MLEALPFNPSCPERLEFGSDFEVGEALFESLETCYCAVTTCDFDDSAQP